MMGRNRGMYATMSNEELCLILEGLGRVYHDGSEDQRQALIKEIKEVLENRELPVN